MSTGRPHAPLTLTLVALAAMGCRDGMLGPRSGADGSAAAPAAAHVASDWSPAVDIEDALPGAHENFNTPALEGCPFISRDGKTFFMASDRDGGEGSIDIWISTRASVAEPWGEPANPGPPINSDAADFCPTLARDGHTFYFVSTRDVDGSCGGGDIYVTRFRDDGRVDEPRNLGCAVNSAATEFSPFPLPQSTTGPVLYFSSTRPNGGVGGDLYMAESHGGAFASPAPVPGVNSEFDDGHPNVRRDGLEMFFYSARPGAGAQGGNDIHVATRASTSDAWSTPVNLGPDVNSAASETRPSLSWDGTRLYFGSSREGSSDIYVTTRDGVSPGHGRSRIARLLNELRALSAKWHDPQKAIEDGYTFDVGCVDERAVEGVTAAEARGMGRHLVNLGLEFDGGHVDLMEPEIALYARSAESGELKLAGLDYVVHGSDVPSPDAGGEPPVMPELEQPFHWSPAHGVWMFHIWLWWDNPDGIFADWNPTVPLCDCELSPESPFCVPE